MALRLRGRRVRRAEEKKTNCRRRTTFLVSGTIRKRHMFDQGERRPFLYIVSQEIPHTQGAGSTLLHRLLEDWPLNRLLVCGPPPPPYAHKLDCEYISWKPFVSRVQYSRYHTLSPPLSWIQPVHLPIKKRSEDGVVLTVMQSSIYYRAAAWFAKRNSFPLAVIVHDDPEKLEDVNRWTRWLVNAGNRYVYRFAGERFCVSPEMEHALRERYGVRGSVLYPNRSTEIVPRPASMNVSLRHKSRLTIGYAGSLVYGYRQGIEKLLPIMRETGVTLRIYSLHKPTFNHGAEVEYAGAFRSPDEVWPRVQMECDAVILPYCDPEDGNVELYRTHFPSKLTEYLALGMPVIVSGPEYATGVRWAARNPQSCIVMESAHRSNWATTFVRLREDGDWRLALASAALAAGARDFDPEKIKGTFQQRLMELQASHGSP
jgi:glycosyltransferase involved in cell wall biosynthesis